MEAASRGSVSEREAYAEGLRRRSDIIAAGSPPDELPLIGDLLLDGFAHDGGEPVGVLPVERHFVNLLRLGPDAHKSPEPTLGDALRLYRKEHLGESDLNTDSRVVGLANRVVGATVEAMERDPLLTSITREDARKVRDEMLDRVKVRGRGVGGKVSPTTVSRELSIIAAVVNFAKVEFGLPDTFQNPFGKLPVARVAKGRGCGWMKWTRPLLP